MVINLKIKNFRVSINIFSIALIAAAFIFKIGVNYILTLIFIAVHEAGHIAAALISGAGIYGVRILPVGFNALIDNSGCSKRSRVCIYSAGPCVNLAIAIITGIVWSGWGDDHILRLVIYYNLMLAFFNLLPILPLDGGRIAIELLSERLGLLGAGRQMRVFSVVLACGVILSGIVVFGKSTYNISTVLIGIYILMCLKENKEETAFMNVKNLLYRHSRIIKKGIYPARELVVLKHIKISEAIKAMDHTDRFHIVHILDENFRVVKVMTEQEILNEIINNTSDTTFDKLMDIEYNDNKI